MDWRAIKSIIAYRWSRHRLAVLAALGTVVVGGVLWGAATPEAYAPTHYIIKWKATVMCTVVGERPAQRDKYKIVWFTTLERIALKKAREFRETGRCGRVPLKILRRQRL